MAKRKQKEKLKRNKKVLSNLTKITLGINFGYIFLMIFIFGDSFQWFNWIGLLLLVVMYLGAFFLIRLKAKPKYDKDGRLCVVADLKNRKDVAGVTEFAFDVIYTQWFVQVGSMLTNWFWVFYLLIPVIGGIKLYHTFKAAKGIISGLTGKQ